MLALGGGRLRLCRARLGGSGMLVADARLSLGCGPVFPRSTGRAAISSRRASDYGSGGFNYGLGERYPILSYFDRPTQRRLLRAVA
jgi:hypothetical protein